MGFATLNLLLAKGAISRIADSMAMAGRFDEVPLRSDRKRVLFMGDSFTEALGVAYEESFVGRFAAAFPQLDVLNGGWPQQLLYDSENSRQVMIWRDWCENKCRLFFNHFSALFEYKRRHPDFLRDLFIWADSHYTARGNETIARDLIAQHR